MKKMTQLAVKRPATVFILLAVTTALALIGISKLKMDSSTEALLPKNSHAYKMLQHTKRIFGDSKTFLITAIEPANGESVISMQMFSHLAPLMDEISDFKNFDLNRETKRLQTFLRLSAVTPVLNEDNRKKRGDASPPLGLDDNGPPSDLNLNENPTDKSNIWKQKLNEKKYYAKPVRQPVKYNYSKYKPISIEKLAKALDTVASGQLKTILIISGLKKHPWNIPLTKKQFKILLGNWEKIFLYKSMQIVKTSIDPITAKDIHGSNGNLKVISLIPKKDGHRKLPWNKKTLKKYRERLLRNPAYESILYAKDKKGKVAALAMTLTLRARKNNDWIFNFLHQTIKRYNKEPVKLTQMGSFMYQKYLREYMHSDLRRLIPLVILVVMFTFYFNFHSKRGVILPTLSVLLSSTWTFGLMGLLGVPISLVVNLLPPLLMAVGSSYSIHILNQYYLEHDKIHTSDNKKEALQRSMQSISLTVLLAAITTFIGFMTLVTNRVISLQYFGLFAAIGTIFSMVAATLLLPASLTLLKKLKVRKPKKHKSHHQHSNVIVSRVLSGFRRVSLRHPGKLSLIALLIVIVFGIGISRLYVESSAAYMLKKDSFLYKADIHLGNLFRGHMVVNLVLDSGKKDGALEPSFLKFIEKFRKWAVSPKNKKQYHILHTTSFGDVIKRVNMATFGEDSTRYRIPDTKSAIRDYLQIYGGTDSDMDGRPDSLESFIDPNRRYINILVRKGAQGNKPISTRINAEGQKAIDQYLIKHAKPLGYSWEATGEPLTFVVLGEMVITGQIISVLLTILLVAIMMIILFKNWISGLLAVIPISVSVVFIYGLMGFLKIPLDIPKAVLAAIAIGIGVDDTIHILKTLRHHLKLGLPIKEALEAAHSQAGLAIVYTSIALIAGFSILLFSEFVPVFYLGLLVSLSMLSTTVSALVLLPAAAYLLRRFKLHKEHEWKLLRWFKISDYFDNH
ncbi:MAG: MMPL family transporter [Spirochaetes bacterium]|nr:MMPL family transporter [Spirochaetota bacterium]